MQNITLEDYSRILDNETRQIEEHLYHISHRLSALRTRKNDLLPIARLPGETLARIFLLLVESNLRKPGWDWLTLTKICQRWRTVALSCPYLWTQIVHFRMAEKIQAFLDRSRGLNLIVALGRKLPISSMTDTSAFIPHEIISMISKHMHRVEKLTISLNKETFEWSGIGVMFEQSKPFPKMSKLILDIGIPHPCHHADFSPEEPSTLTSLNDSSFIPRLQKISFRGFYLRWNHLIYHGLSELTLDNIAPAYQATLSEFFEILLVCPNLSKITLRCAGPNSSSDDGLTMQPIDMRNLSSIQLTYIDYSVCKTIFNCLIISEDIEWYLTCLNYPFDNPEAFIPTLIKGNTSDKYLHVRFDHEVIGIQTGDGIRVSVLNVFTENEPFKASLSLIWQESPDIEASIDSAFSSISNIISEPYFNNATNIFFLLSELLEESVWDALKRTAWQPLLRAIPNVKSLIVQFPYHEHGWGPDIEFVEAFIEPLGLNSQTFKFPDLQYLSFDYTSFSDEDGLENFHKLIGHLIQRRDNGMKLRTLTFNCCENMEAVLEELKESNVADELEIFWN